MAANDNQKLKSGLSRAARTVFGVGAGFFCAAGLAMFALNPEASALHAGAVIALGLVLGAVSARADLLAATSRQG